jgi:hypothetical protein
MAMDEAFDARLRALMAKPMRAPDEAFVARLRQNALAETRLRAARRAAWRRFAVETAAATAALLAFLLLARLRPGDSAHAIPLTGPFAAGILLLGLWAMVSARPESGSAA